MNNNSKFIVAGDINIDLGDCLSEAKQDFVDNIQACGFISKITVPTRITNHSATTIDHIWVKSIQCFGGVIVSDVTDHYFPFLALKTANSRNNSCKVTFRDCSNDRLCGFYDDVGKFISSFDMYCDLDVDLQCKIFCEHLYTLYDKNCPLKTKIISRKRSSCPWITDALLRSINRKHFLHRQILRGYGNVDFYRRYRNVLTFTVRQAKKDYYAFKFNSVMGDTKAAWKTINNLISSGCVSKANIKLLVEDDYVTDVNVADKFNDYFVNVARELEDKIPNSNIDPLSYLGRLPNSFVLLDTNEAEVLSVIKSLKNKRGHNHAIPVHVYKAIAHIISPAIASLINSSFREGRFPDILKLARVVPLFKSGQTELCSNYRPISTLHLISKVFEKIMYSRLSAFLDKFDVLYSNQFGFRRGRSTDDAVLQFTDEVYNAFNKNKYLVAVMLDLSKAFDTVQSDILLGKLECIGVRGVPLQWFRSYLTCRKQFVSVNNENSSVRDIAFGVPQGSVLAPLLFLIYINDMHVCSDLLGMIHFADDTTVYTTGDNFDAILTMLNIELEKIDQWLQCNRLSLNVEKTSWTVFSNRGSNSENNLYIRQSILTKVSHAKFLGVFLDEKLKFSKHVDWLSGKISRSCGVMFRLSSYIPSFILRKIYFALVHPYLNYGLCVYGSASATTLARIKRLQLKCVKYISGDTMLHEKMHFRNCRILPFDSMYKKSILMKFGNYVHNDCSLYFNGRLNEVQLLHTYSTRHSVSGRLNLPVTSKSRCGDSFFVQAIKAWNELPQSIRETDNVFKYKRLIKNHLFLTM